MFDAFELIPPLIRVSAIRLRLFSFFRLTTGAELAKLEVPAVQCGPFFVHRCFELP